jgi:LmbE family N-acetylglucosaminyl deacetylase
MRIQFDQLRTILCLGAHADDIEIGCGGTLLRLLAENRGVRVVWVVVGAEGERANEARRSADLFLQDAAESRVIVQGFRDTFFPYDGGRIKEFFRELPAQIEPDIIFSHRREDLHQDHRLVAELTWNTFRRHLILEYEIPKYEGDLGTPNVFAPLSEGDAQRKIAYLLQAFPTQLAKPWFRAETFWALLRLRGLEAASPTGLAEGLYGRKMTI